MKPYLSDEGMKDLCLDILTDQQVRDNRELQHLYNARYCGVHKTRELYEAHRKELLDLLMEAKSFGINHLDSCDSLNDDKAVVVGEPGTGPWDTGMEPAPCNCGLQALLSRIEEATKPTEP